MGPLIILSGPSGSGKSTVIARLLARGDLPLRLSVSATTRPARVGEIEGVAYHFWDRPRFEHEIQAGGFLEWAEVHGNYYGTLRREVEPFRERGMGVILDIDVHGADQVRRLCPEHVSVFLHAPSPQACEQRLRQRGTEDESAIQRRLARARNENSRAGDYHYQITNEDLNRTVEQLHEILTGVFAKGEKHAG